jgi:hypothetical protein
MPRPFKTVGYDTTLDTSVRLRDCLPPTWRTISRTSSRNWGLGAFYGRYAPRGVGAAAYDTGFCKAANVTALEPCGIDPDITTGRGGHHRDWHEYFAPVPGMAPGPTVLERVCMAAKLHTEGGKFIYRGRKCSVEPVFGIVKEELRFRQFSLRGLSKIAGEWCLVCLAYNLKRLQRLAAG